MPTLYGLVDCARDERLFDLVMTERDHRCLFGGRIQPPIQRVAPYIVNLGHDSELRKQWAGEGWGQNWGIMCLAEASLADIRRHFRNFLQAMIPGGEIVLFRFYDPRIWRPYLPTCNTEELAAWFHQVDEYVCEAEDGRGMLRYTLQNGALKVRTANNSTHPRSE